MQNVRRSSRRISIACVDYDGDDDDGIENDVDMGRD
jgi:hypothetical protein